MEKRFFVINALMKKCPRCQEGDLFIKPFDISKPVNMPTNCPVCNQKYEPEPGFYYGAMFVSYIVSAFFFLSVMGISLLIFKLSLNAAMGVVLFFAAITYLFWLRFSRALWINIMVNYDPNAKADKKEKGFSY